MRVLFVASFAPSLLNLRGPLIAELVERGVEVVACAPAFSPSDQIELNAAGVRCIPIRMSRTGISPIKDFATYLDLRRVLAQEAPDRVLAYTAKPVIYSGLAARGAKRTRVYAMITGLGYAFGDSTRQRAVGRIVSILYRHALKGCAGVFFQNSDDRALFAERGLISRSTDVVMINGSGVDLDRYRPTALPDAPIFLLTARLLADKGVREYYEAARRLKPKYPRARFQLAGHLDDNPLSIDSAELARWQTEGVIEYLGSPADVRVDYANCQVYVLPSYREGTPRTVLEAMAMGRPIVTTDAPGCRETVIDGVNGMLVPVRNSELLAEAMEKFIVDPGLAARLGAESIARVRDRFDARLVNRVILAAMKI